MVVGLRADVARQRDQACLMGDVEVDVEIEIGVRGDVRGFSVLRVAATGELEGLEGGTRDARADEVAF